ncbi:hypothetical protein DITRI_Ditri07aG0100300 [Diplodiscus trichospermus]
MAEWQQLLQSIFIGLIFSYLLAKLISLVVSFKEDNLSITRARTTYVEVHNKLDSVSGSDPHGRTEYGVHHEADSVIAEAGSVRNESDGDAEDDDDDWEGVECTELDEAFSAAAAADRLSQKVSNEVQLQLYGLYKIATEGPCTAPQPSALKMTARAKWQAWHKLGAMPPEEAMQKYIDIVTELYPTWAAGSAMSKSGDDNAASNAKGLMGPVFSSFVYEEESGNELKMHAIHAFAREGQLDNLLKCIESGVSVHLQDSEGRTPLHWAVDRGHIKIVEALVSRNANVNAKDNEGQTPLHYAVVCEREDIAEFLVEQNVDKDVKDNDGYSPLDLSLSRRLGYYKAPHFNPLVSRTEKSEEEKGLSYHVDPEHVSYVPEVEDAQEYFDDEGNLNITQRLMILFPYLDNAPKDGLISAKELGAWNEEQASNRLSYTTDRVLSWHDKNGDGAVSFNEYLPQFTQADVDENQKGHGEAGWWMEQFNNADADRSGNLTSMNSKKDSNNEEIQKWQLREKMKNMDDDHDGKLNLEEFHEYAYNIYKSYVEFENPAALAPTAEDKFAELDINKDKYQVMEELRPILRYLFPGELFQAKYFTSYLMHEADDNKDGNLSVEEMLNHENIFYNSVHDNSIDDDDFDDFHDEL